MISLSERQSLPPPLQATAEHFLKYIFHKFLLFLAEKKIFYSLLPRQAQPRRATVSALLRLPMAGGVGQAVCSLAVQWADAQKMLNFSIEFRVERIRGRALAEWPQRARVELISAIGHLNRHFQEQRSALSLLYDYAPALIFYARTPFLSSEKQSVVRQAVCRNAREATQEMVVRCRELSEVDFLGSVGKIKEHGSLGELLHSLYAKKLKMPLNSRSHKTIKGCLSLLLQRTAHITAITQLTAGRHCSIPPVDAHDEPIAHAISILAREEPIPALQGKLQSNLTRNEAVSVSEGGITLKKVTFELRRSFGWLRPRSHDPQPIHNFPTSSLVSDAPCEEHLVLKKCLSFTASKHSSTHGSGNLSEEGAQGSKTQAEVGHENEHNFLMVNGNLRSPYIGKYYLDLSEGCQAVSRRTIMTRFERGDLFTEVAYVSHNKQYHFTLGEYLMMFEQLAQALVFLARNRVLHRDIKPTNVLFRYRARNALSCRLIDFGSCFLLDNAHTPLFNSRLFTTPNFNLTFRQALKRAGPALADHFTQAAYETHELFDIYGIAKTVDFLLQSSAHESEFLKAVVGICENPHPGLRFTAGEVVGVVQAMQGELASQQVRLLRLEAARAASEALRQWKVRLL